MQVLKIRATSESPAIHFEPQKERFEIIGNSMPEDSVGFYEPVIEWLKQYVKNPMPVNEFIFKMNMLNTASTKIFVDIFKLINDISEKSEVKILWYYNYGDDDIHEVGTDFRDFVNAPFEMVAFQE
jgi:hypothetical protein